MEQREMNIIRGIRLTAAALALAWATPAQAQAVSSDEWCSAVAGLAETIMTKRQEGFSMTDMMRVTRDFEAMGDLARSMIREAFEGPRYQTREYQDQVIREFTDNWAVACYNTEQTRDNERRNQPSNRGVRS